MTGMETACAQRGVSASAVAADLTAAANACRKALRLGEEAARGGNIDAAREWFAEVERAAASARTLLGPAPGGGD